MRKRNQPIPMSILEYPMPDTMRTECDLLNSLINDTANIIAVQRFIKPEYFSNDENRKVWETIMDMFSKGEVLDILTITARINKQHYIDNIMGMDITYGEGVVQLADALMSGYIKRMAYRKALSVLEGVKEDKGAMEVTSHFTEFIKDMEQGMHNEGLRATSEIAAELASEIANGKTERIPTPFKTLNLMLYGGFAFGSLVILAARPSVGKTTIALQMAVSAAKRGRKVCFFSLEMTSKELVQRLIVGTGKVSTLDIVQHKVDWTKYGEATTEALSDNLLINDKARSLREITSTIAMEARAKNCDIAFIDYLGLISHDDRRKTQAQVIGDMTKEIKGLAKSAEIPIVLLCQLNRESAKEIRPPQLYDLRDSGNIEQDADVVVMLDKTRDEDKEVLPNRIDMLIQKNRNGRTSNGVPIKLKGNDCYALFQEDYEAMLGRKIDIEDNPF